MLTAQKKNLDTMLNCNACYITHSELHGSITVRYDFDKGGVYERQKGSEVRQVKKNPPTLEISKGRKIKVQGDWIDRYKEYGSYLQDCLFAFEEEINENLYNIPLANHHFYINDLHKKYSGVIEFNQHQIGSLTGEAYEENCKILMEQSPKLNWENIFMKIKQDIRIWEIQNEQLSSFLEKLEYNHPNLVPLQQTQHGKLQSEIKLIVFNKPETIDLLQNLLEGYFIGREADLKKALNGKKVERPLFFPHNQNKFVEVFKRVKYNGLLISSHTEIKDWLCINFNFKYKRGTVEEIKPFNKSTVWSILTKEEKGPTKKERICIVDWLPNKRIR